MSEQTIQPIVSTRQIALLDRLTKSPCTSLVNVFHEQQKRREKFPYRWKERYFILERQSNGKHTLQYFEDKESSKDPNRELGAVDLSTISNVRV